MIQRIKKDKISESSVSSANKKSSLMRFSLALMIYSAQLIKLYADL